ncbi:tetratricopeptide repeat protein [Mangrovibacter sp. SLW1]
MCFHPKYLVALAVVVSAGVQADITEARITADCAKISHYAADGEAAWSENKFAAARAAFEEQVSWSEQCDLPDNQIAAAYNAVARTYIQQKDYHRAWAWLMLAPGYAESVQNLALIKDKLAAEPFSDSPDGVWWKYAGRGIWQSIQVSDAGDSKIKVDFEGYAFGLMGLYNGPNMGHFIRTVALSGHNATVKLRDNDDVTDDDTDSDDSIHCNIHLKFTPDQLTVTTDKPQQCGFGHNVTANGTWVRVQ